MRRQEHPIYEFGDFRLDPVRRTIARLDGTPVELNDVMQAVGHPNGQDETLAGQFDAASGTLLYAAGGLHPRQNQQLVWVDREGVVTPLPIEPGPHAGPRISPNGELIAYFSEAERGFQMDLWTYDLRHGTTRRLTFDGATWCVWSPDSRSLLYLAGATRGLAIVAADGSTPPVPLAHGSAFLAAPSSWSQATNSVAAVRTGERQPEIWTIAMHGAHETAPFLQAEYAVRSPAISPDGHWIAYASWETGIADVYVERFPQGGDKIRVSTTSLTEPSGGSSPVWSQDGRELFYVRQIGRTPNIAVYAVDVDTTDGIRFGPPRELFGGGYIQQLPARGFDVTPDGQRFIMLTLADIAPFVTQVHLVLNWDRELERALLAE